MTKNMTTNHKRTQDKARDKRLMRLRLSGRGAINVAIAAPLASGALLIGQAALLANVLGQTIENGASLASVTPFIVGISALVIVRAIIGIVGEQAGQVGAENIKRSLRERLFGHILANQSNLSLAPASGAVSASIVDQVEAIESFFARYIPAMIAAAFLPLAFAVVLMPIDWIVGVLFLLTAPAIPLFMALAGMGAQAATDRQANALARLSGHFADRLRGLTTLRLFGRQQAATDEVYAASEELRRRTGAVLRIAFLSSAILEFFAALGVAGVALYVGLTYLGFLNFHPGLTLVAGLFALIMAPEVYQPLRQLAAHYHDRAAARSALAEIERHVAQIDELITNTIATKRSNQTGPIGLEIANLAITSETGTAILEGLALNVVPGETLAIMGPSGSGKTTLARAITRLIPATGTIALNGTPLADLPEPDLRAAVCFITQKPRIFHGTILENIAFADPQAAPQALLAAAQKALVTEFAQSLPNGLDTLVGEGGVGLSGGQAQRVALARLFLTNPGLVILDEPTAHLDAETEARLLDAIFDYCADRTLIILTHSRSTALRADRALRLAGGKLHPMPHRPSLTVHQGDRA